MTYIAKKKGFTLVELSIVLIIIGLIVSGVLVGQDLIDGAKLRATVTQVEQFNTAVNTFKLKYDALPGDIVGTTYGLTGAGDNDGLIEGTTGGATGGGNGEPSGFWTNLSTDTNLIPGAFTYIIGTNATATLATGTHYPAAKTGANGFGVYGVSGVNYYQLGQSGSATADSGSDYSNSTLTALQAFNIDSKLDNGKYDSGIVIAAGGTTANGAATTVAGGATACINSTPTPAEWGFAGGDTKYCQLRIKIN